MRTARFAVNGRTLTITNIDKVLYPDDGVSKGDVLRYYHDVAAVMLSQLRNRPVTLRRYPDGIQTSGFFQKEASAYFPDWIRVTPVPHRSRPTTDYVVCDDEATLLYLAGQACLEFHIVLSTADRLKQPDLLAIDIDPPDGTDVRESRGVACRARDLLDAVGLVPFIQTTGGRGFHVVAPLDGEAEYGVAHELSRVLASHLVRRTPDRLTTEQRKDRRGDRIFLDVNRNGYRQTIIAPYSLRARAGAPAATPIDWSELAHVTPAQFGVRDMSDRLAGRSDPWAGINSQARSATAALAATRALA